MTNKIDLIAAGLNSTMSTVTFDSTVPVSNAWGTLTAPVPTPYVGIPPYTTTETFSVAIVGGTAFDTTHLLCFSTTFHECVVPIAVGSVSGGVQSVTANLRHGHTVGYVFQGPSYGMEAIAYTQSVSGNTYRYLIDIVGCTTTLTCQGLIWQQGRATDLVGIPNFNFNSLIYGCVNLNAMSNSGTTTVSFTQSSLCAVSFSNLSKYPGTTIYINNATDSAFNGNCTNVQFTSLTVGTCTESGLTGTHTATSATAQLSQTGQLGLNNVKLWQFAEVLDVQNETTTPPSVDAKY